jgi:hypothetical protein
MKPSLVRFRVLGIAVLVSLLLSSIPPLAAPPAQARSRSLAATAFGPAIPPDVPSKPIQVEAPPVPHPEPPPPSLPAQAPIQLPSQQHHVPLAFVPNVGQSTDAVRFQVRAMGGTTFFTDDELVLTLPAPRPSPTTTAILAQEPAQEPSPTPPLQVLHLRFDDANRSPQITGSERLPGVVNYLLGDDPSHWRTQVPS